MEVQKFCQSCTLPLDAANRGTEKNGAYSDQYCKYCYQDGAFTDPALTLEQMTSKAKTEMSKGNIPENIIQRSINMLPTLKRWSQKE